MFLLSALGQLIFHMGIYRWPMILIFFVVLILILKKLVDLYVMRDLSQKKVRWGINAIIFWGGLGLALGLLGQVNALWLALQEIMEASDISPTIVLIGYYLSFSTTFFGLMTFIVAALGWWLLRSLVRRKLKQRP